MRQRVCQMGRASWRVAVWSSDVCSSDLHDPAPIGPYRSISGSKLARQQSEFGQVARSNRAWFRMSECRQHIGLMGACEDAATPVVGAEPVSGCARESVRWEERRGGSQSGVQTCALPIFTTLHR